MSLWRVEVDGDYADYTDCFFNVVAGTKREAWKKALELEDRKIIRIYEVKKIY